MENQGANRANMTLVAVGDTNSGKTSMILQYTTHSFPETHIPTVLDNYLAEIQVNGRDIKIELCDTGGAQRHEKLRGLSYIKAKVFFLCFSLVTPSSFFSIKNK